MAAHDARGSHRKVEKWWARWLAGMAFPSVGLGRDLSAAASRGCRGQPLVPYMPRLKVEGKAAEMHRVGRPLKMLLDAASASRPPLIMQRAYCPSISCGWAIGEGLELIDAHRQSTAVAGAFRDMRPEVGVPLPPGVSGPCQ